MSPRPRLLASALAALALTVTSAIALPSTAAASPDVSQPNVCPAGTFPVLSEDPPSFTDTNVSVYVGGNLQFEASELEGVVVVQGDAVFTRDEGGLINLGTVGVGTQIAPAPGSTMAAIGGDLTIGEGVLLDVGAGARDEAGNTVGGNVDVVGQRQGAGDVQLNGGTLTEEKANALEPWAQFGSTVRDTSADLAGMGRTGGALLDSGTLTFTGDGRSSTQVFTVDGSVLAGDVAFAFTGIPDGAVIVVNVIGAAPVASTPGLWLLNDQMLDPSRQAFADLSARLAWNFTSAESVHLSGNGQFLGSIFAPVSDVRLTTSTNGRVLVGGDLLVDGSGSELHNYPWVGAPAFTCQPVPDAPSVGGFQVAKAVTGPASQLVPADTVFTVSYSYTLDGEQITATLAVPADGTLVPGPQDLPEGTVVTFAELDLPSIEGVRWGAPVFSDQVIEITASATVTVTVTNQAGTPPTTPQDEETPEPSPTEPAPQDTTTPSPTAAPVSKTQLAKTGAGSGVLLAVGAFLVAAGAAFLVIRRRLA